MTPSRQRDVRGRIGLAAQRALTADELAWARTIAARIVRMVESRDAVIAERGLDRAIALPGANWTLDVPENVFADAFRYVAAGDERTLNTLRFWTQMFSGYQLRHMRDSVGTRFVDELPRDYDAYLARIAPTPDEWVDRWLAVTACLPEPLIGRAPRVLGEIGWDVDGFPVNHDVWAYQTRVNLLLDAGVLDWLLARVRRGAAPVILEIGGGYGGLAAFLKQIVPDATYVVCDLPESLLFSALYLGLTHPGRPHTVHDLPRLGPVVADGGFHFLPNYLFDDLVASGRRIDLALNTISLSEMTEGQVRSYGRGVSALVGQHGLLFEQNQDHRAIGFTYCKLLLQDAFACRHKTIPFTGWHRSQGEPDFWSNRPLPDILAEAGAGSGAAPSHRVHAAVERVRSAVAEMLGGTVSEFQISLLRGALSAVPAAADAALAAARDLLEHGASVAAVALMRVLLEAQPRNAAACNLLGEGLFALGRVDGAEAQFLRAAALDAQQVTTWNNLAVLAWHRGRVSEARAHLDRAAAIDPDHPDVVANRSVLERSPGSASVTAA